MADNLIESRRKIILNSPRLLSKSGSIVSIDDAIKAKLKSCIVDINPVQSGSGNPSPDNIRPISGWTKCNVTNGLNLISGRISNALIGADGKIVKNHDFDMLYAPIESGKKYYIKSNLSQIRYGFYTNVPEKGETSYNSSRYIGSPTTFTAPISGYIAFTCSIGAYGYVGITPRTIYPISWQSTAGTVYGGTLDATNGILTVTHGEIASYDGETLPGEWISDRDVYAAGTTPTTGAQVVYELAEPIIYSIIPTQISTLFGINNIFADTGDISVKYLARP